MSKRDRQRRRNEKKQPAANSPAPLSDKSADVNWIYGPGAWLVFGIVLALVLFIGYKWWTSPDVDFPEQLAKNSKPWDFDDNEVPDPDTGDFHGHPPKKKEALKKTSDNFLDDFNQEKADADKGSGGEAVASGDLEKRFQTLVAIKDQILDLREHEVEPGAFARAEDRAEHNRLMRLFDHKSVALDKELSQARQARPEDAVPRWLTGELLDLIDGEPEATMPHLEFARTHGLKRARLFASLSRGHLKANQFADAYRDAVQAVELSSQDRYAWNAFVPAAACTNQFDQIVERLDRAFPTALPAWAQSYRHDAAVLQSRWLAEQKLRVAEARANDLPRVRLVIEHRRFAKDPNGQPLTTIESTGRAQVIVELFENEAPNTVANFIELVERKFYDGTRFHLVLPPKMVIGGDPNSKNDDPASDGPGGPGYVIRDESDAPGARTLFHGSLCMFNARPGASGSQFFFALMPPPGKQNRFTVFGRIIQEQDAVDRITRGHTNPNIKGYGRIIPGDLLVRAEVIRKRPHAYRAIKE